MEMRIKPNRESKFFERIIKQDDPQRALEILRRRAEADRKYQMSARPRKKK